MLQIWNLKNVTNLTYSLVDSELPWVNYSYTNILYLLPRYSISLPSKSLTMSVSLCARIYFNRTYEKLIFLDGLIISNPTKWFVSKTSLLIDLWFLREFTKSLLFTWSYRDLGKGMHILFLCLSWKSSILKYERVI